MMLPEIETQLAKGIDLKELQGESSLEILSMYLRNSKEKTHLSHAAVKISNTQSLDHTLEDVKNNIALGNLDYALGELEKIGSISGVYEGEVVTERLRIYVLKNELEKAQEFAWANRDVVQFTPVTKMTFLQVYAHCNLMLEDYDRAFEALQGALSIGKVFSNAKSYYQSMAFFVVTLVKMNRLEEADKFLYEFNAIVEKSKGEESWPARRQVYLRGRYHYLLTQEKGEEIIQTLLEAKSLSLWIGDNTTYEKCVNDLAALDLNYNEEDFVMNFVGFTFFRKSAVLLHGDYQTYYCLEDKPVFSQMLNLLCESEVDYEDFYQKVWGLQYDPLINENHVRSYISKLRKFLPKNTVKVKSQVISLKRS